MQEVPIYLSPVFWVIVKLLVLFFLLITAAAYYTLAERKWAGYFQDRYGPNRAGPWGILQPLADGIKFLTKQETIPRNADKWLFLLAPAISMTSAVLLWAVIPFSPEFSFTLEGKPIRLQLEITDLSSGVLYVFAVGSISVYGVLLAGWASNNKYSLLGSVRASAQMISYEASMLLSVVPVVLMAGSMNLEKIILAQKEKWFVFTLPGFIGFFLFLIAMFAETNRTPFDLAEAESELIVGFHTEYGAFKFALFFIAEYMNMIVFSFLISLFFLGGWNLPSFFSFLEGSIWETVVGSFFFLLKALFFVFLYVWVRWSIPRFRYDQVMHLGWKYLLPLAFVNVFIAGIYGAI